MVPNTWLAVLLFVLLIVPGLFFDLLAEHRWAGATESTFREGSRVILASCAFTGIGLTVVAVTRAIHPSWMLDPGRLLRSHGREYLAGHYRLALRTLVVEGGIALSSAGLLHLALAKKSGASLRAVSTWRQALRDECPEGKVPHVRVRLEDGVVYLGRVRSYTADLETEDRELVLAPPLFVKGGEGKSLLPLPKEWERVVLAGRAMESMVVQYRAKPPDEA